jgi:hypothetical protein
MEPPGRSRSRSPAADGTIRPTAPRRGTGGRPQEGPVAVPDTPDRPTLAAEGGVPWREARV